MNRNELIEKAARAIADYDGALLVNARCRGFAQAAIDAILPQVSTVEEKVTSLCGHCGRTLTDDESRAYGIGPKCRGKLGL